MACDALDGFCTSENTGASFVGGTGNFPGLPGSGLGDNVGLDVVFIR